jgi:hypothetical protein
MSILTGEIPEYIEIIILRQVGDKNACDQGTGQVHRFKYALQPGEQPTALDVLKVWLQKPEVRPLHPGDQRETPSRL